MVNSLALGALVDCFKRFPWLAKIFRSMFPGLLKKLVEDTRKHEAELARGERLARGADLARAPDVERATDLPRAPGPLRVQMIRMRHRHLLTHASARMETGQLHKISR